MDEKMGKSTAKALASAVNKQGEDRYVGLLFPVPTRLTLEVYSMVEVLTSRAGTSRNKMMNQLVQAGIESVISELDDDVVQDIHEASLNVQQVAIERNGGLMEREDL